MTEGKRNTKAPWWGALIGFGVAAVLSYSFILPTDVRTFHMSHVNVGDWVRVAVAFIISLVCAWMGYIVGDTAGDSE